jgi:cytochrome c oxidase subunit 2
MFDRTKRIRRVRVGAAVLLGAAALAGCSEGNRQNSLEPAGEDAQQILDLFTPFFWVAVVIGVLVVGGTIYVALRFREKPGQPRNPKQVHGNAVLEVGWTIVPLLILAVMAVPTIVTVFDLAEEPEGDEVLHVRVEGRQWWWEFEYTEGGLVDRAVVTANELHIPVGTPVALTITAPTNGVIHSFWVPNLAGKKDAVPGREHFLRLQADEAGTFLGQCAEYCGVSHANMRLRVVAQPEDEFRRWLADQQEPLAGAAARFVQERLAPDDPETDRFEWGCTSCHTIATDADGDGAGGARIGPNLTRLGDRTTFAAGIYDMNLDNLTEWVWDAPGRKPAEDLVGWMPSFKDAGMTREEAAEIARFLLCDTATDPSAHAECTG